MGSVLTNSKKPHSFVDTDTYILVFEDSWFEKGGVTEAICLKLEHSSLKRGVASNNKYLSLSPQTSDPTLLTYNNTNDTVLH